MAELVTEPKFAHACTVARRLRSRDRDALTNAYTHTLRQRGKQKGHGLRALVKAAGGQKSAEKRDQGRCERQRRRLDKPQLSLGQRQADARDTETTTATTWTNLPSLIRRILLPPMWGVDRITLCFVLRTWPFCRRSPDHTAHATAGFGLQ